jgi:hypothetical protein
MTAAWGESGSADEGEHHEAGEVDHGNGRMVPNWPEIRKRYLHGPRTVAKTTARANEIRDAADQLVGLDARTIERLGEGQPAYTVEVTDDPDHARAHGKVLTNPDTLLGRLDNAHNHTLLKAMDQHPSDPR